MGKNMGILVTIIIFVIGIMISWGKMQADNTNTKEIIVELKKEVKTAEEEIDENKMIDLRQSIILESITEQIGKLNDKLDKDLGR